MPLPNWLRHSKHVFLNRLLPHSCALCGLGAEDVVCNACQQQFLAPHPAQRCQQCALVLSSQTTICGQCQQHRPAYDATFTAADYLAPLDQLVLGLKFAGQLGLAAWMAARLRDALLQQAQLDPQHNLPDLLCPVPLGKQRLSERGYNQALEIARPLSQSLGLTLDARLCLRQVETGAQSLLPLEQRAKNIKNAFLLAPHAIGKIDGLHIGVVDDVMTSGRTLDEMAKTLKRFGASRVSNFIFARTPPPT